MVATAASCVLQALDHLPHAPFAKAEESAHAIDQVARKVAISTYVFVAMNQRGECNGSMGDGRWTDSAAEMDLPAPRPDRLSETLANT